MARLRHGLSTLRHAPYDARRKTRFRLLAKLYRVGLVPHKVPTKGFQDVTTSFSPFPSLRGAGYVPFASLGISPCSLRHTACAYYVPDRRLLAGFPLGPQEQRFRLPPHDLAMKAWE